MTSRLGRAAQAELRGARWTAWRGRRRRAWVDRHGLGLGRVLETYSRSPIVNLRDLRWVASSGSSRRSMAVSQEIPPRSRRACCPAWTPARRLAGVDLAGKDAEIGPPPETARARGRTTGRGRPDTGGVVQAIT